MSERKGVEKNISVRAVMTGAIIFVSLILAGVSIWFNSYLVTTLVMAAPALTLVYSYAQHNYEKNLSSTRTGIKVDTCGNRVVVTCSLRSSHPKRLFIDKAYLFIDSGDVIGGVYNFSHILKHEYGDAACLVEKKMSSNAIKSYQDINPGKNGYFVELKHLSSATILYLDPKEEFSDDCVVQLESGVYRAMFVTTFKNADCNCAIKHFIVGAGSEGRLGEVVAVAPCSGCENCN